jgi:tetratricopeptide (TPR) repeat protein
MKQNKLNQKQKESKQDSIPIGQQLHQPCNQEEKGFNINTKYNYLLILVIFIAGIIAYSNSFDCSFHFDDKHIINSKVTAGSANIHDWFRSYSHRPVGMLTFFLNYSIHKIDVWGYHLVNLIIHLFNAFLIWWLTWLTLSTPVMRNSEISKHKAVVAFLTGILFVTHPLATQSVTYIAQRFASLATLFYLLSLGLFVQGKLWQGNKNIPWLLYGCSMVSAVLGILTKEIVYTLPFAILLYQFCFLKTDSWKLEIKNKGFIIIFVIFLVFIFWAFNNYSQEKVFFRIVPPNQGYSYSISMKEYFLTQFSVILTYIRLFVLPINQNLDYDYRLSTSFFQLKTFFSFSILLGIFAAGVLLFKRYRLIAFAIFWFFLTLSVESSILPISQNVIFEHRTYLPGFGFFLALTSAFFYFSKEKYFKIAVIILLIIATVNTVLTYQRNKVWKNDYTLWADCANKSPNKARPNNNFCHALFMQGKSEEAINYCNKAISLYPGLTEAYNNKGLAYDKLKQYDQSIENYNKAIQLDPRYASAYNNRGMSYHSLKKYQQAIEDYNKALSLQPDFAYVYSNRGSAYFMLGQYENAIEDYDKAIQRQPDYASAYKNRSSLYFTQGKNSLGCNDAQKACELGDCKALTLAKGKGLCGPANRETAVDLVDKKEETVADWINREQTLWNGKEYSDPVKAVEYLNNAIKLKQDNASYYNKRGLAYYHLGNYKSAMEDYSKAIRLKPDFAMAYYNRGCVFIKDPGQYNKAIEDFNKAIRLNPGYIEAYNNLCNIYLFQEKRSLGCSNAQKACELGDCKLKELAKSKGYCP